GGERVVAAGVEEHQLDLGISHGLVERQVDIDGGAELDVHFRLDVGIDRQQVVRAGDGDAVTGIEEHRDIGTLSALAEVEQLLGHLVAGEIGALDDLETDIAENASHGPGVDRRVRKLRHILVAAVADDKGDALVGQGRLHAEKDEKEGGKEGQVAHLKSPGIKKEQAETLKRQPTRKATALRHKKMSRCPGC